MSEVLDLQVVGRWEGILGKSMLAPFSHSFPGVDFHSYWRQNTGLEGLWSNINQTLLWSNAFVIFVHIITP